MERRGFEARSVVAEPLLLAPPQVTGFGGALSTLTVAPARTRVSDSSGTSRPLVLGSFFFSFLFRLHLQHMEVPRPGAESELQLQTMPQPWQRQILNPLSYSRSSSWIILLVIHSTALQLKYVRIEPISRYGNVPSWYPRST